ncbi:MAG: hypothetical protein KBB53_16435 [Steroidobacteraceae bacterium]|nr:hypothetical protein [Steroidobacteraceae bacterium]MBP7015412.1 hypothetical protein [Steroidobacteraceae bacterium]
MTSELVDAPDFRLSVGPAARNGLRVRSQVMADKPVTVRREMVGPRIGSPGHADIVKLSAALALAMGLADSRSTCIPAHAHSVHAVGAAAIQGCPCSR